MMTVKEVSRRTGVSVRALRYYDKKIGLLRPQEISDAGYRLYDDTALFRLQKILLLRELQFSRKRGSSGLYWIPPRMTVFMMHWNGRSAFCA